MASMAAPSTAPTGAAEAAARLKKELEFVSRLISGASTVDEYVAAANAAANIADAALKASNALAGAGKEGAEKTGAPHVLTLCNLPATDDWGWSRLKRFLGDDLKLKVAHVEKLQGSSHALLRFFDLPTYEAAKAALAGRTLGSHVLEVQEGETPQVLEARAAKRARDEQESGGRHGKKKARGGAPGHINEVVCPWWQRPYREQLVDKYDKVADALKQVTEEVVRRAKGARAARPAWVVDAGMGGQGQATHAGGAQTAAPLLGVMRSPQLEQYRNKSEFTCGLDQDGRPCVGFLLGGMANGISAVSSPQQARHISREAKLLAAGMQTFLTSITRLPVWNKAKAPGDGFWRLLLVRDGRTPTFMPQQPGATAPPFGQLDPYKYLVTLDSHVGEEEVARITPHLPQPPAAGPPVPLEQVQEDEPACPPATEVLLMVQVNPCYGEVVMKQQLMADELAAFARHMRAHAAKEGVALKHVMVQYHSGVSNAAPSDAAVAMLPESGGPAVAPGPGEGYIHDSLCDLRFRISPTAFFQVNAPTACVLYKVAAEWASPGHDAVLFDVCCGTGTIGITLARQVSHVVGVDITASAIEDAKANAALNGITNVEYVCGKAEDVLPPLLQRYEGSGQELVAIVDPPRSGLHKHVVRALLACAGLKRLVYVSCNPSSMAENLAVLCSPPPNSGTQGTGSGAPSTQQQQQSKGGAHRKSYTPFVPVKAVAVDLFPHTAHVECVMLLER